MDERAAASVADTADSEDNQESPAVELIAADLLSEMFPIQSIPGNLGLSNMAIGWYMIYFRSSIKHLNLDLKNYSSSCILG